VTTPRSPGERGYGAYWKQQVRRAGLAKLRGLPEGIGGRALLAVLTAFGDRIDNQTGEAWPSQQALAQDSGQGKRTVERALKAARRLGWLVEIAPPVPRIRGTTYRATVPCATPADRADSSPVSDTGGSALVAPPPATHRHPHGDSSPPRTQLVVSADEETPRENFHIGTPTKELRPLSGAQELPALEDIGKTQENHTGDNHGMSEAEVEPGDLKKMLDLREQYLKDGIGQSDFGLADLRLYRPWLFQPSPD
jgi:hypothetical protein